MTKELDPDLIILYLYINVVFSEENCHKYVYLLEISNEGIKTDVQEVVQEGIDKCFSILI